MEKEMKIEKRKINKTIKNIRRIKKLMRNEKRKLIGNENRKYKDT